jgi:LmbE family N-acetylglucosaminyl deacetylase
MTRQGDDDGRFRPSTQGAPGSTQVRRRRRSARRVSRPPLGAVWGWAQVAMAQNATETLVRGTALVLSPHPDDETIGCGLLLAQKAQNGHSTSVILATDGDRGWFSSMPRPEPDRIVQVRHREWHRALDALHVPEESRFILGFADGTLGDHEEDAAKRIGELLRELTPSQVFVTKPYDAHPDHQALARATRRAIIDVYGSSPIGEPQWSPAVYNYRVYPGEGIWPEGRPSQSTPVMTLLHFARSAIGLMRRRPLVLRAPSVTSDKTVAITAYESQRKLLDGELRYVWRTGVELYWKMDVSEPYG